MQLDFGVAFDVTLSIIKIFYIRRFFLINFLDRIKIIMDK